MEVVAYALKSWVGPRTRWSIVMARVAMWLFTRVSEALHSSGVYQLSRCSFISYKTSGSSPPFNEDSFDDL